MKSNERSEIWNDMSAGEWRSPELVEGLLNGSTTKVGKRYYFEFSLCLTALSDDAQAVVVKVPEAVCSALYEFHLPVEAFGDGVVFSISPHTCDLL